MARCEDFPCCGHEAGCCPDFDDDGRQLNMKCTCGATVPLSSRSSICPRCLGDDDEFDQFDCDEDDEFDDDDEDREPDEPDDSMDGDLDSGLASAGHGMDEDYNGWDDRGDY